MSRDLLLLAISLLTWGVGEGMFLSFEPLYLQQLGADPLRIGAIISTYGIAMTLAHIPAGHLSDRIGRRPLLWLSWGIGLAAAGIMALATSLPVFTAGMILYGITFFVMSPLNSYATAARGRWSVSQAIMLVSAAFNLGGVAGPLLGGAVADRYGLRAVFIASLGILAISLCIVLFIRAQPVEEGRPEVKRTGFLFQGRYLGFLLIVFLAVFATYLPQPLSQNFLHNERGLSYGQIGRLVSLAGLGVVGINLVLSRLDDWLGFLLAQAAVGLFALLLWKGAGMAWFAAGYFLLGGYKSTRALAAAKTRSLVQAANMGLAYGVTETVGSTATILAPLLAGFLYSRNPIWIYSFGAAGVALSLLASAYYTRRSPATGPIDLSLSIPED